MRAKLGRARSWCHYRATMNERGNERGAQGRALHFSHPAGVEHDPRAHMPEHPDTPERLLAIERVLADSDWLGFERCEAPASSEAQLELIHSARLVEPISEPPRGAGGRA